MLTVSLLLLADFSGFFPNNTKAELTARKAIAESLAVQLSTAINYGEMKGLEGTIHSVVERNASVLSAGLRSAKKVLMVEAGAHLNNWQLKSNDKSNATQIQVSIFDNDQFWGTVEIRYRPLVGFANTLNNRQSFLGFSLFVAFVGFFVYMYFLKKVVHELNTDDVIPERVGKALDTLTEGILIVDDADFIVFSNDSFAKIAGEPSNIITGKRTRDYDWYINDELANAGQLPWAQVSLDELTVKGDFITLISAQGKRVSLAINATAIGQADDHAQGVLITFDNVSDVEEKNSQLEKTLGKLQQTQKEVTEQNQQLQILATRDPLTNTLNRRSLFQGLETLISETFWGNADLCFIMVDIDHFKSVNDNYGHSTGDRVIVFLSQCLAQHARTTDLIARFGGEEFCVVLPNTNIQEAVAVAERIRLTIETSHGGDYEKSLKITASFGVSTLSETAHDGETLLEQADSALYKAKNNGRNQVVMWQEEFSEQSPTQTPAPDVAEESFDVNEIETLNDEISKQQNADFQDTAATSKSHNLASANVLLLDRIEQAILRSSRYKSSFAVISLDIEILQRVSDTLGSAVGQKMLNAIVDRLKSLVRDTDSILLPHEENDSRTFSISSVGNRDIVLLLTDLESLDGVNNVIKRITQSHKTPLIIEGNEYIFNADMGISLYPQDGSDSASLLKNSSIAKSEAVRLIGGSNFCFYHKEIEQLNKQFIQLEAELLRAIERDEMVIFYQPKIDLRNGDVIGVEALVRWQHPHRGLVPPDDFIPLAEKTGLIEDLSNWVIRSVCKQIRAWQDQKQEKLQVSINLSPVEFRNSNLANNIIATVMEFGVQPQMLEVEITEAIAVHNMECAIEMLQQIAQVGIGISVDDFGTGYASLSYLQQLPIDKIKIDKSFINGVLENDHDAAIVSAVIAMGHTLGLVVIAEGVETLDQMHFLQDLQCDQIQGYLISRPLPREQLDKLIANKFEIKKRILNNSVEPTANTLHNSGTIMSIINKPPVSPHASG